MSQNELSAANVNTKRKMKMSQSI